MKYIKQLCIIIGIACIGEILNHMLPLPIPASIYGLCILFICLVSGVIRLEQVKETANFLIEIMPVMFIPAAVGLLDIWDVLRPVLLPVMGITLLSTILVMAVTGIVTQKFRKDK